MDSLESNPEPRFLAIGKGVMLELSTLTKGFFSHFEGTTHEDIDQFRKKKRGKCLGEKRPKGNCIYYRRKTAKNRIRCSLYSMIITPLKENFQSFKQPSTPIRITFSSTSFINRLFQRSNI